MIYMFRGSEVQGFSPVIVPKNGRFNRKRNFGLAVIVKKRMLEVGLKRGMDSYL
jgi:hypothetical protein